MTVTRLALVLCIGFGLIDYELNDGRLIGAASDLATQYGVWLSNKFSGLANSLVGH